MDELIQSQKAETAAFPPASKGEILAWASYDIANSSYATVVATAVYNAYFVDVIAANIPGTTKGFGTLMLTVIISVSAILVVVTAPIIGTICDAKAAKKKCLFFSTFACIITTMLFYFIKPGQYVLAMVAMTVANFAFFTGEDLIAAFLPELAHKDDMGRISSVGWAAGYVGGLVALGACATYMAWAQHNGQTPQDYVPTTMLMCAVYFGITVLPTLIWLKERAIPDPTVGHKRMISVSFERLGQTLRHARHYRDLFKFLITLFVYSCGTTTIVHMAAVYAQQVFHFAARDLVMMILCINVTAAVGAVVFGFVQDKIGSIKTLGLTLTIWLFAILLAVGANSTTSFWIAGNVVGIAMGASGSVGRALVAQFSPPGKSGEFLGLWGVAVKLATCVGALSFGFMTWITGSNYRLAMLSICAFFIGGIFLLSTVDEKRGRAAALTDVPNG